MAVASSLLAAATRSVDIGGEVRLWDFGGDGRPIVLVHGLGGSRSNWVGVVGAFTAHGRVVVPDLIGFGDTPPVGRTSDVHSQVDMLAELIHGLGAGPAVVVGNSMGGLIGLLLAARHPSAVDRLVLVGAALPTDQPRLGLSTAFRIGLPLLPIFGPALMERLARGRTAESYVDDTMGFVMADPRRLDPGDRAVLVEFATRRLRMPWATQSFADASRSIARTLVPASRFESTVRRVTAPTMIVQGADDQVVRPSSARWLAERRPEWPMHVLAGVGHVPQLEVPDRFAELVIDWLD